MVGSAASRGGGARLDTKFVNTAVALLAAAPSHARDAPHCSPSCCTSVPGTKLPSGSSAGCSCVGGERDRSRPRGECSSSRYPGLSKHDSEAVLRLVQLGVDTFKETGECLDWTRMAQVDAMTKEVLANSGDGWCEATITIPSGTFPWLAAYAPDGVTFAFEHKDMEAWLGVVYSDRNHKGHFAVEANMRFNQSNSRVYEHPWDGDLWIKYQYEARVFFEQQYYGLDPGSVAIAAVQMYSDKTSVNHKGGSMHPVRATLLNIAAGRRWEHCLYEVAMIPDMSRVLPSHLPREKRHLLKLVAINLCIAELLAPPSSA